MALCVQRRADVGMGTLFVLPGVLSSAVSFPSFAKPHHFSSALLLVVACLPQIIKKLGYHLYADILQKGSVALLWLCLLCFSFLPPYHTKAESPASLFRTKEKYVTPLRNCIC